VDREGALAVLGEVRVVAERVDAALAETTLLRQPLGGPKGPRVL